MAKTNALTDAKIRAMKEVYESGLSIEKTAKACGVSGPSVIKYRDLGGWKRGGTDKPALPPQEPAGSITFTETPPMTTETINTMQISPPPPAPDTSALEAEYEAKLAAVQAELAAKEEELKRLSPTAKVELYETAEDVIEILGYDKMEDLAYSQLGVENKKRFSDGKPQLDFTTQPELVQQTMQRIASEMVAERTKYVNAFNVRTLKMVSPTGNMVQIPVEEQISNEAGQQGAAVWKMREKGFKIADPYICQRFNCWLPAVKNPNNPNKMQYSGYCSPEHLASDPYLSNNRVEGVTTSRMVWNG